ncbi:MAG: T9SS type A sorting domain-containing protein [Chitinophagaceae bacterium]
MKVFYNLFIILLVCLSAKSQERSTIPPNGDPVTRIVKFYPNPATSFINFEFQKSYDKSYSFHIINLLGKKVFEANNVTPKTIVNLSDFFRGIYIFQLRDQNGKVIDTGKFQVSK